MVVWIFFQDAMTIEISHIHTYYNKGVDFSSGSLFAMRPRSIWISYTVEGSSPCDRSRKQAAVIMTTFVKPRLNCDLKIVIERLS